MTESRWRLPALLLLGAFLVLLPFLAADSGSRVTDLSSVDRLVLGVGLTFIASLILRQHPHERRLSWVVLLLAASFSAKGLTGADEPSVFTAGLLLSQLSLPLIVWIGLGVPSGRLRSAWDRLLVWASLVAVTVLWIPTQMFTPGSLFKDPLSPCGVNCQQSLLFVADRPGLSSVFELVFQITVGAISIAVGWRMVRRMRSASRPMRRTLAPIFLVALARFVLVTEVVVVEKNPYAGVMLTVTYWLVPIALILGVVLGRLTTARAMLRLVSGLERRPDAAQLRDVMAQALEDPSLTVYYWLPAGQAWADPQGVLGPVALESGPGRSIQEVHGEGGLLGAIDVDERMLADPEPWGAVLATARIAMESNRALMGLALSEARAETAEHRARRELERDLHDGAQQRLIALRMKVSMLRSLMDQDIRRAADLTEELGPDIDAALAEVRSVAHGDRPEALVDGLAVALERMAEGAPVTVTFTGRGLARYAPSVEEAVYFTCLEALQNAAKHAGPSSSVEVSLCDDAGTLTLEVHDNGVGFEDGAAPSGHGLTHMRERFAGCGGRLAVHSNAGNGVLVRGTIPLV